MTKQKIFLVLIVLALILIIPNISHAATELTYSDTEQGIEWGYYLDESNNVIDLKCKTTTVSGDITIPSTIDGKTVISLKGGVNTGAFQNCYGITNVTIPETITSIGGYAFANCTGLKTLIIPNSVTRIADYAFNGCSGLTNITLSEQLTVIGKNAIAYCSGLKSIVIPNSVTTIGIGAFAKCSGLKEVTLSENLTKIDEQTFSGCSGLKSIIIPDSVTTIVSDTYYGAFKNCNNLEKVLIPDNVASIEKGTFEGCDKLTIYGNDGQASKSYAEENEINFKYISQWNESDVGDDVTPPTVEKIYITYSSFSKYNKDANNDMYIIPADAKLVINVVFSETVVGTTVPTLTIKFGSGENIQVTEGTVGDTVVTYIYTIKDTDKGTMSTVSLSGGNLADAAGNAATLSCPALKLEWPWDGLIYANGTATNPDAGDSNQGTNDNENQNQGTNDNDKQEDTDNSNNDNNSEEKEEVISKKQYGTHTYYIFEENMTWEEAKEFCEKQGGYLVTINSKEEQQFIEKYITEKGYTNKRFWIGLNKTNQSWGWVTKEKFDYSNWGEGQPDSAEQKCAVLHGYQVKYHCGLTSFGQWDNLESKNQSDIYFICEWGDVQIDTDNNPSTNTDKDSTTATGKLPDAGAGLGIVLAMVTLVGACTLVYSKYRKMSDI